jgi:hypothetical protein
MTVGELVHFPKITWKLQQKKLKRGCAETKHQQNKKLSRFIWGKSSPKNETKKLKMGEDLAEMLKMIEKQAEKQTRQLEKQARDSEAWLENMIEKRHNELKGSIDDIKSEVILKMIEKHTNKQSQLFEKRLEKLKEIALQDERKTEIKHDMSEIQKTKSEYESRNCIALDEELPMLRFQFSYLITAIVKLGRRRRRIYLTQCFFTAN